MERLNCPDNSYAFKGCIILNTALFVDKFNASKEYVAKIGLHYYPIANNSSLTKNQCMMNFYQRRETSIEDTNNMKILPKDSFKTPFHGLILLKLSVSVHTKNMICINEEEFIKSVKKWFIENNTIITANRTFVYNYEQSNAEHILILKVSTFVIGSHTDDYHFVTNTTFLEVNLSENIVTETNSIFNMNLNLVELGVGGLDSEFSEMFRRAFTSRMLKPDTVNMLGVKHIKGILLYGPPGCGKTLIVRKLCKMINSVEPKIVNGPEIMSKYVGESEEKMRRLFVDAEEEYKKKKDHSQLHVIVFDEIDSLCRTRGTTTGTGVNDSIVNQLLTKFDGVNEMNNVIIIGMTNRIDMIDPALLRPGRFELQLRFSLPDESGRVQILTIHTKKLKDANKLDLDVNIKDLSLKTENFTGAEIEGLVNSARSYALQRAVTYDESMNINESAIVVKKEDFDLALNEIKPRFGLDMSVKDQMSPYGILMYSEEFKSFYESVCKDITNFTNSANKQMLCFVKGRSGSGRTNLSLHLAVKTGYTFVKYISGKNIVGLSDLQTASYIKNCFDDADKSNQSVIVFDDIEDIIGWVYSDFTGVAKFSNIVCSTIKSLINYSVNNKRLVIFTSGDSLNYIEQINILPKPNRVYEIPVSLIDKRIRNNLVENSNNLDLNLDQMLPIKSYIFEFNAMY